MKSYVKKPVVVQAAHWNGSPTHAQEIVDWINENGGDAHYHRDGYGSIKIHTLEGVMRAAPFNDDGELGGDWIIRGVNGEFYPCKPDIFARTYEELT